MTLLLVAFGGSLGAVARGFLDARIAARGIGRPPLATLAVNVSGSFGLGLLVGLLGGAGADALAVDGLRPLMSFGATGFLAAYTTFSTWMFESARLFQRGAFRSAAQHLAGTVFLGVAAAVAGLGVGSALAT